MPGITSIPAREPIAPDEASRPAQLPCAVLLVGPEGMALRSVVEAACGESWGRVEAVASMQEAIAASAKAPTPGRAAEAHWIFTGVASEERLELAVRGLRRANPTAQLILLCDAGDEVACRRALQWGATDYWIIPVEASAVRALLSGTEPSRRGGTRATTSVRSQAADRGPATAVGATRPADEPAMPLIVQTELLEDLLGGREGFIDRAVARLQRQCAWNGNLRFIEGGAEEAERKGELQKRQIRRAVAIPEQGVVGTLILETETATPALSAALAQAANWLAGMVAVARREEQLRLMAITDDLSGAYNRRYFVSFMTTLLARAKSDRSRVTLLLFDIDDFKKYNDTFGHGSGDAIIRELIKLLRACTRPHDLVARIGGDEFAVVYWDHEAPRQPNSDHPKDVIAATERFREAIRSHHWPQTCNIKGDLSISGGMATFPWDADTLEQLMAKADEALLKAKAAGKNVIVMHALGAAGGREGRA